MKPTESMYVGCLLGLACGDAMGAPQEGGMIERLVWRFIGKTESGSLRWTDDTQMSLDLAKSLLAKGALFQDDGLPSVDIEDRERIEATARRIYAVAVGQ